MLYGGLIASRTGNESLAIIEGRMEWLAKALGTSASVEIEIQKILDGGALADAALIGVSYTGGDGGAGLPNTFAVKFAKQPPGGRAAAMNIGVYEAEVKFFQEVVCIFQEVVCLSCACTLQVAPTIKGLTLPHCYGAFLRDPETFVIIQENLAIENTPMKQL